MINFFSFFFVRNTVVLYSLWSIFDTGEANHYHIQEPVQESVSIIHVHVRTYMYYNVHVPAVVNCECVT